jgi:hypothetical protein
MATDLARSPRTGDWVTAISDNRDAKLVEGVLHLRHVPSLGYVQVLVHDTRLEDVNPDSIQVIRPAAMPIEELEGSDPLRNEPTWRRIESLDDARSADLLLPAIERVGGTWDDLFAGLRTAVSPLIEVGWKALKEHREESWEYGDSVSINLRRAGESLEIEYYADGQLAVHRNDAEQEVEDDDETEPILYLAEATPDSCREAFQGQGWLK